MCSVEGGNTNHLEIIKKKENSKKGKVKEIEVSALRDIKRARRFSITEVGIGHKESHIGH